MTNQKNKIKLHINIKNEDNTDFFKFDTEVKGLGEAMIAFVGLGDTFRQCMLRGDTEEVKTCSKNQDRFMELLQTNIDKFQQQIKEQMK